MCDLQKVWLQKLHQLHPNVSHTKGAGAARFAPHKPLLLLAILDLAKSSGFTHAHGLIEPTIGLRLRFLESWAIVVQRWGSRPDIQLPFYHLGSQDFWRPLQANGQPAHEANSAMMIKLHPDFATLLAIESFRVLARHVLIQTWFPVAEQAGLYSLYGAQPDDGSLKDSLKREAVAAVRTGRDARFRIQVVTRYFYTCALTGYTLTTTNGSTMVQAAHIADFATSRINDPSNGLALTPDAHWSFDEHLWTVDEKLRVVVSKNRFIEGGPEGRNLLACQGRPLVFHSRADLRPDEEFLAKHRAKFVG